jgi:hypothetical protein
MYSEADTSRSGEHRGIKHEGPRSLTSDQDTRCTDLANTLVCAVYCIANAQYPRAHQCMLTVHTSIHMYVQEDIHTQTLTLHTHIPSIPGTHSHTRMIHAHIHTYMHPAHTHIHAGMPCQFKGAVLHMQRWLTHKFSVS